jgi:hypothetical protein
MNVTGARPQVAGEDLRVESWELTNKQFYEDVSQAAPAGQKLYRMKRDAADAEGAERCVAERREDLLSKKDLSSFCRALFSEIAPTFLVVLRSGDPGEVTLEDITVEVKTATVLKGGHGYFTDDSYYDLFIKAAPSSTPSKPRKPFKFKTLGSADLRLGFDLSPLGASAPAAAIEFVLKFQVEGIKGTAAASTPLIRIEF